MSLSYNITVVRGDPLNKAFRNGNYQSQGFTQLIPQMNLPGVPGAVSFNKPIDGTNNPISNNGFVDGIFLIGEGNLYAPLGLTVFPYCQSGVNINFSMRVYGWRSIIQPDGTPSLDVWIPFLLAEFNCWTCNQSGPFNPNVPPFGKVSQDEYFCDTMVLTQGSIGAAGTINSTGGRDQGNSGTDLIAYASLEIKGSRFIQFDFQTNDSSQCVSFNCLWGLM